MKQLEERVFELENRLNAIEKELEIKEYDLFVKENKPLFDIGDYVVYTMSDGKRVKCLVSKIKVIKEYGNYMYKYDIAETNDFYFRDIYEGNLKLISKNNNKFPL